MSPFDVDIGERRALSSSPDFAVWIAPCLS
jgi:hypothetical protein